MAAHRSCKCRLLRSDEAIKQVDAKLLYLPPYSLDLNPIEQAFSEPQGPAPKGCRQNR